MTWSPAEVETILEQMRAGASVQTGGSRCHTTYFHRAGEWGVEDFDEGHSSERRTSEASILQRIASEPELFRGVLKGARWRRFTAAFVANQREASREQLRAALEYGDSLREGEVLEALLAWPEAGPSSEVAALIRDKLSGFTAYHVFMGATGWDRSPAAGVRGIAFADQLIAMVGEALGCFYLRSAFHEQAGDLPAAERDMILELERCESGSWQREHFQGSLDRLRRRAQASE